MKKPVGPRGGTTTQTMGGLLRATVFLAREEHEMLRNMAHRDRVTISELVRRAIIATYGEPPAGDISLDE